MEDLSIENVRRLLAYDPDTGVLSRKISYPGTHAGAIVGTKKKSGHLKAFFQGKTHQVHRLAWFHYYGTWPKQEVDHINGIPDDNRICNLRDVNRLMNTQNRHKANKANPSGVLGVFLTRSGKFETRIVANGKGIYLGRFQTLEEARATYLDAKQALHVGAVI